MPPYCYFGLMTIADRLPECEVPGPLGPWCQCLDTGQWRRLDDAGEPAVTLSPPTGPGNTWHVQIRGSIDLSGAARLSPRGIVRNPPHHASGSDPDALAVWADATLRAAGVALSTHLDPREWARDQAAAALGEMQAHARDAATWADWLAAGLARAAVSPLVLLVDPDAAMEALTLSFALTAKAMRIRELADVSAKRRGLDAETLSALRDLECAGEPAVPGVKLEGGDLVIDAESVEIWGFAADPNRVILRFPGVDIYIPDHMAQRLKSELRHRMR